MLSNLKRKKMWSIFWEKLQSNWVCNDFCLVSYWIFIANLPSSGADQKQQQSNYLNEMKLNYQTSTLEIELVAKEKEISQVTLTFFVCIELDQYKKNRFIFLRIKTKFNYIKRHDFYVIYPTVHFPYFSLNFGRLPRQK